MSMKSRLCVFALVAAVAMPLGVVRADGVVPVIKLNGPMAEAPSPFDLGAMFGKAPQSTMFDLLRKLRKARTDDKVKAVVFDIEHMALGMAQIQELRAQFKELEAAGKDVWVFCETLNNGTMMLGSASTRLRLMPRGEVMFTGLYGEGMYFKEMLSKLHLEADILHCGAFKSAGEPFTRTGPSKEAEEQQNWLLDSLFEEMLGCVAESRQQTTEKIRGMLDKGIIDAPTALEAGLVDKLEYREDVIASLKTRYGADTDFSMDYGISDGPEIDLENPFGFFKLFGDLMKGPSESTEDAVAVVYVEGPITTGPTEPGMFGGTENAGSDTIRKAIAEALHDDSVKALVLRVDSPGGSAIASEIICEATERFKNSGRPFVVSMGNVAASGGYYVSTQADAIFAEPMTITGSIGVVGGKIITQGFFDWIGINGHEYKRGKRADLFNTNRPFNDDEKTLMMDMMNRVYGEFKDRVTDGRGSKLSGDIEGLAGGRVYTGKQGLEHGLVDKLGGLAAAIDYAADQGDLAHDYEIRVYPRPKSLMDIFSEAFGGGGGDDGFVHGAASRLALDARLAQMPQLGAAIEALQSIDPAKAKAVKNFLTNVKLLSSENVLMVGPVFVTELR